MLTKCSYRSPQSLKTRVSQRNISHSRNAHGTTRSSDAVVACEIADLKVVGSNPASSYSGERSFFFVRLHLSSLPVRNHRTLPRHCRGIGSGQTIRISAIFYSRASVFPLQRGRAFSLADLLSDQPGRATCFRYLQQQSLLRLRDTCRALMSRYSVHVSGSPPGALLFSCLLL